MNQMALYLSTHLQIHEILMVLGAKSSANLIFDICKLRPIDHLNIYVPTTELRKDVEKLLESMASEHSEMMPKNLALLEKSDVENYRNVTDGFALVFDALAKDEDITSLTKLKPRFLVGTLCKDNMNAFTVWEAFRKISEEIYICSWKTKDEILNWQRVPGNDIELSVIFPMYNIAKYLPKCIESVTAWDAEYVEYLFVDDGSPDNCAEIVEEYAKKDARIHLLRKENGGCASARQYGLERARGRYVGFIDPDDYIDPSMYRKLLSRALIGGYEISYCGYKELYETTGQTKEIPDALGWPYNEGTTDPVRINELIAYQRVAIWRGIYSKNMIDRSKIHFYTDIRRFDDLPFKVETLAKARSVVATPEYLYYYRMSRPGQDIAANDERLYVHFPIFKYLDEFIAKCSDRTQVDYLQAVKLQTHLYALRKLKPEFIDEYCRMAKEDLDANFSFTESCYVLKHLLGKKGLAYYIALHNNMYGTIKRSMRPKKHRVTKNEIAVQKLSKL